METHPKTGAAQLVEIRETVKEVVVPIFVQEAQAVTKKPIADSRPLFADSVRRRAYSAMVCPAEWLRSMAGRREHGSA